MSLTTSLLSIAFIFLVLFVWLVPLWLVGIAAGWLALACVTVACFHYVTSRTPPEVN